VDGVLLTNHAGDRPGTGESHLRRYGFQFFEHFISTADAINHFDGTGLWDEDDGFYYDHLRVDGSRQVSRTRSMVASSQ
jgi:hypothetical protein